MMKRFQITAEEENGMTFWEITCANLCSMAYDIILMLGMVRILLGRVPDRGNGSIQKHAVRAMVLGVLLAVAGTVCYLTGFWKIEFEIGQILWEYFVLAAWTVFVHDLYRLPLTTCWSAVLLGAILDSYGELLAEAFVYGKFFHLSVPEERRSYLFWLLVILPACRFFCLLFVRRAGRAYRHWAKREERKKGILLLLSLYPMFFHLFLRLLSSKGGEGQENLLLSVSLLLVLHLILVYEGRDEQQKERILQQQISLMQQSAYIEQMEQIQTEVRRFRHDFKNMMAGMYLQAGEGDLNAVQRFIQEMTEDFDRQAGSQIRLMNQLANVHMTEVKGLLLEKLLQMQKAEVACELEVFRPLEGTRIRSVDLCRCLGILLDNAVEEVSGKEDGQIHVLISSQEQCTTFRVKNTLYGMVDLHRVGTEGYSTKGNGRGVGLSSYRRITDKYDFVLTSTAVQDGCFIQELKIQEISCQDRYGMDQEKADQRTAEREVG